MSNEYWWNWNKTHQNNTKNFSVAGGRLKEQSEILAPNRTETKHLVQHRTLDSPIKLHGSQS